MLQMIDRHGTMSAVSYRLTFKADLQKWAREAGLVERSRNSFQLTSSGREALRA